MNSNENALDHKCPNCGGKVLFSPKIGKWRCESCASEFELEELQKYNNASSEVNNRDINTDKDTKYIEYQCQNCGAQIVADAQTAATFCIYCGNTAILRSKLSGKFAPSRLIPFSKTKDEAIAAFQSLNKGRPLLPKFFNDKNNIEKVSGVYIPFWLFTIDTNGKMTAEGNRTNSWRSGDYMYTKTDVFLVDRDVDLKFDKVPVDGSTRFDDDIMNSIEPFDFSKLVKYNHAYLSGFLAEMYDVEDKVALEDAKNRTTSSTKDVLNESMTMYSTKVVKDLTINHDVKKTEYVLLPVWMVNVKYRDKYYTFAMNAQTGEFVGNMPINVPKAILIGFISFILFALIIILISYLVYLGG